MRRAKRPLNAAAVSRANAAVGRKLSPTDPKDAAARQAWMDAYIEAGGDVERPGRSNPPAKSPAQPCAKPCISFQYLQWDDAPVAAAKYKLWSVDPQGKKDGVYEKEGTLDGRGQAFIPNVPEMRQFQYYFHGDPQKLEVRPASKPKPSKAAADIPATESALDGVADWIWGTLQGDFNKEQSLSQTGTNMLLGLIPVVDQALDLRDLIANIKALVEFYMEEEEEQAKHEKVLGLDHETWLWCMIFITAIGAIPELGSLIKGVLKMVLGELKQLGKTAGKLSPQEVRRVWEMLISVTNRFSKGNGAQWLKEMPGKLSGWLDTSTKYIKAGLDRIKDLLEKALSAADNKVANFLIDSKTLSAFKNKVAKIRSALDNAYSKLDAMKSKINNFFKEQLETITGKGPHHFEGRGVTGSPDLPVVNSRVQTQAQPPDTSKLLPNTTGRALGKPPQELLTGGELKVKDLMDLVPQGTPNKFVPSQNIKQGYKYQFTHNGTKYEVKYHSPDANAAAKFPGSRSGSQWTAQVKVNGKLLGSDGKFYTSPSDLTHIPIDIK